MPQEETIRQAVHAWMRDALQARLEDLEPPAAPADWNALEPAEARAAALLGEALTCFPGDVSEAAHRAAQAEEACHQAAWTDAVPVARFLASLPAFLEAEHRQQIDLATLNAEKEEEYHYFFESEQAKQSRDALPDRMMRYFALAQEAEARAEEERAPLEQQVNRLDEVATNIDALLEATRRLQLHDFAPRVANTLLDTLAEAMTRAARMPRWDRVARYRARYLRWWPLYKEKIRGDQRRAPATIPLAECRRIGETVGSMHAQNITHGSLLLENFDPGGKVKEVSKVTDWNLGDYDLQARLDEAISNLDPHGADLTAAFFAIVDEMQELRQKSQTQGPGELNYGAFIEDLTPLYFQLSPAGWAAFTEGYASMLGQIQALVVLQAVASVADHEHADHEAYPYTPLSYPHFAVRACTYALRHFPRAQVDFQRILQQISDASDVRLQVRRAVDLALASTGIDDAAADGAARLVLGGIADLLRREQAEAAVEESNRALEHLQEALDPARHHLLHAYRHLALAEIATDIGESAASLQRAARSFVASGSRGAMAYARQLLEAALERAPHPFIAGPVAGTLLRCLIDQALHENNGQLLQHILDIDLDVESYAPPHRDAIQAYRLAARGWLTADHHERQRLLKTAATQAAEIPYLADFRDFLAPYLAPEPPDDAPHEGDDGRKWAELRPDTIQAMERREWDVLARLLYRDLQAEEARAPGSEACQNLAAMLASTLQQLGEFAPHNRPTFASTLKALVERYAPILLAQAPEAPADRLRLASKASNLGWSAVALYPFLPQEDAPLLDSAIELLELAVRLTPRQETPASFSIYANNLALGYRARAKRLSNEEHTPQLEKAVDLFLEVIDVDEALRNSDDPAEQQIAATAYLDHFNLGLAYHDLAKITYDSTWISQKPLDSARWYRKAADAFARSRDLAVEVERLENAATAQTMLAVISIDMCKYYVRERRWSGGDLKRALYDWFCTVEGRMINTADWVDRHAQNALAHAAAATEIGLAYNPALLLECIQLMMDLWSLAELRDGIPDYLKRHIMMTLLETYAVLEERGFTQRYGGALAEVPAYREYVEALLRADLFDRATHDVQDLQAAHASLVQLSTQGGVVTRALARPRARWLDVHAAEDGIAVNGLFVGSADDGIELRILSQRRRLHIGGFVLDEIRAEVRDALALKAESAQAVTYLEPQMNWGDVPATLATLFIQGRTAQGRVVIRAARLPTASWDSWVLQIFKPFDEDLILTLPLPYSGMFDIESSALDTTFPAACTAPGQVFIFGEQGLALDVALPLAGLDTFEKPSLALEGSPDAAQVRIQARQTLFVLRATPRVASADVAWIVKDDSDLGAACCAAAFPLVSPSFTLPASIIHSFSPLFCYQEAIPDDALAYVNELDLHEVVMVGLPDTPEALDAALDALFDPRRELFLLVEPHESEAASEGVARLRHRATSSMGARLLGVAASDVDYYNPFDNVQLIEVPRALVAAAAQMLLDLAALRQSDIEHLPLFIDGRPTFLNQKGNPVFMRREGTLFQGLTGWSELVDRYCRLVREPLGRTVVAHDPTGEHVRELTTPRIQKRPCFVLPPDRALVLAAIPYARHLGALVLPESEAAQALCVSLQPEEVYLTREAADRLPEGPWTVHTLPENPLEVAPSFQQVIQQNHATLLEELADRYPHMLSSRRLLEEMEPSQYVVLATDSEHERPWSYLAANYAAALGAPLVLLDGEVLHKATVLERGARLVQGTAWRTRGTTAETRDAIRREVRALPHLAADLLGDVGPLLTAMKPTYLGFVSSRASTPIELIGTPPLSTAFAIGRLAGPDLTATAILIARAALSEDVSRPPHILALLAEAADAVPDRPLPGARQEVDSLYTLLAHAPDVQTERLRGETDLDAFLDALEDANLVHFAGHGHYDDEDPRRSGLIFRQGTFSTTHLTRRLAGAPLIYSNACESGLLREGTDTVDERGWSGLAASFIAAGAVNYLGSLWPIFDESSRQMSETFYTLLNKGYTAGEALRQARLLAYNRNDPTWAAIVLFGCPRSRLRAPSEPAHDD